MRVIAGHIIKGFASVLDTVIKFIIAVLETMVNIVLDIGRALVSVIAMGGCLLIFLAGPILFNPVILPVFLILLIFPLIGKSSVHWLEYINYSVIEFLNDYGDYLIDENKHSFSSFGEYKERYRKMQEEKERREREKRRKAQEEEWERRFRDFFGNMNYEQYRRNYRGTNYGGYHQGNRQSGGTYQNPVNDFVRQYEEACDVLGVSPDADKYQIKLQYRKLAKKYHPDISDAPDANEKFQKINVAYDFLSDENIERYQRIKKN